MKQVLSLKEYTKLSQCHWDKALISYKVDYSGDTDKLCLYSQDNKSVAFQLSDAQTGCNINFLTDLKPGEEKIFTLTDENNYEKPQTEECQYKIIFDNGHLFQIISGERVISADIECDEVSYSCTEKGDIYSSYEILCKWKDGRRYTSEIKLINGLPFFEFKEKIDGFFDDSTAELTMSFEGFDFNYRQSMFRPMEKIDQYVHDDGVLPIKVYSYDSWINWGFSRALDFYGKKGNVGLFVRDNNEWDDYKYLLWTADCDFGIYFTYRNKKLKWHFPLKTGKRFLGITVFNDNVFKNEQASGNEMWAHVSNQNGENSHKEIYTQKLWQYHALTPLDRVKDYKLDWEYVKPEKSYFFDDDFRRKNKCDVKYCDPDSELGKDLLLDIIYNKSEVFEKPLGTLGPVSLREIKSLAAIYDLTAHKMTYEDAKQCAVIFAFMAYFAMDENFMPTRKLLAGHPNFLVDVIAVAGYAAAIIPQHPDKDVWVDFFNDNIDKNFTYHVRPDIEKWKAKGGRATENPPSYNFANISAMMSVCMLFMKRGYRLPNTNKNAKKLLNWNMNILSAPVEGRRIFMPQGAHCDGDKGFYENHFYLYELAKMLLKEYPEEALNFIAVSNQSPLHGYGFIKNIDEDLWSYLYEKVDTDVPVKLESQKFTGYGYVLRHSVGTPEEISVHIQQLDRGPNYRWGGFRNTGNGGIYYCASNKRYSFNGPEDTGDMNLSANEGSCTFSVLNEYTHYNIGFNELTSPFVNFGFVQQVHLRADKEIERLYKYRKVMLVENDYIVIYDAVRDMTTRGRFTWFVQKNEEFPKIFQLKPGSEQKPYMVGETADYISEPKTIAKHFVENECFRSKGVGYDGNGDFLTVVSHRDTIKATAEEYGARVCVNGRENLIFCDNADIEYKRDNVTFVGRNGIISKTDDKNYKCAIICGEYLKYDLCEIKAESTISIALICKNGSFEGKISAHEDSRCEITINGIKFGKLLKKGEYSWSINDTNFVIHEIKEDYVYEDDKIFRRDDLRHEYGFNGYNFDTKRKIYEY